MIASPVLEVSHLTKVYKLYHKPSDRLVELFLGRKKHTLFYANKDITFSLAPGETLGIIGLNGAGKSTLLKQIAGVIEPTSGTIHRIGRITALLELGTGFNPDLTGYENIFFNAMLLGLQRHEIQRKLEAIIDFSELGEFIHEPLRTYSSGMVMRLAFAIAIHTDPSLLIVDEALAVGDAYFSAKCTEALKELRKNHLSTIYVSHDLNALKILCDRLILLHHGQIAKEGDPEEVINHYNYLIAAMHNHTQNFTPHEGYGAMQAKILDVQVRGHESGGSILAAGEEGTITVTLEAYEDIRDKTLGILIRDRFGQDIFGTNTYHHHTPITLKKGERAQIHFTMPFNLGAGEYTITAALHEGASHTQGCIHWRDKAASFSIAGFKGAFFVGLCRLEPSITCEVHHD